MGSPSGREGPAMSMTAVTGTALCALAPKCLGFAEIGSELCSAHLAWLERPIPDRLEKTRTPHRFVVVVSMRGHRSTIHRVRCHQLRSWDGIFRPVRSGTCPRLCGTCRPTEEEIRETPPLVEWEEQANVVWPRRVGLVRGEDELTRRAAGYGRVSARSTSWR